MYEYCIPTYNGEDNWKNIEGFDAEDAARNAAQIYNEEGDYTLMHGDNEYVLIREVGSEEIQIFPSHDSPGVRWMPWHQEQMKDVDGCDKPR